MGGMKKQMVMFIPQTVLMGWINYCPFFSLFLSTLPPAESSNSLHRIHPDQTSFPSYTEVQIYASGKNRHPRYGRYLGFIPILVLPLLVWLKLGLWLDSGRPEQWSVFFVPLYLDTSQFTQSCHE